MKNNRIIAILMVLLLIIVAYFLFFRTTDKLYELEVLIISDHPFDKSQALNEFEQLNEVIESDKGALFIPKINFRRSDIEVKSFELSKAEIKNGKQQNDYNDELESNWNSDMQDQYSLPQGNSNFKEKLTKNKRVYRIVQNSDCENCFSSFRELRTALKQDINSKEWKDKSFISNSIVVVYEIGNDDVPNNTPPVINNPKPQEPGDSNQNGHQDSGENSRVVNNDGGQPPCSSLSKIRPNLKYTGNGKNHFDWNDDLSEAEKLILEVTFSYQGENRIIQRDVTGRSNYTLTPEGTYEMDIHRKSANAVLKVTKTCNGVEEKKTYSFGGVKVTCSNI